eukprot:364922-Chlamydomonas_euryale.AAC.7
MKRQQHRHVFRVRCRRSGVGAVAHAHGELERSSADWRPPACLSRSAAGRPERRPPLPTWTPSSCWPRAVDVRRLHGARARPAKCDGWIDRRRRVLRVRGVWGLRRGWAWTGLIGARFTLPLPVMPLPVMHRPVCRPPRHLFDLLISTM